MPKIPMEIMNDIVNGILESNKDMHPTPKALRCAMCKLHKVTTDYQVICKKYPSGIPMSLLTEKEVCKDFQKAD